VHRAVTLHAPSYTWLQPGQEAAGAPYLNVSPSLQAGPVCWSGENLVPYSTGGPLRD